MHCRRHPIRRPAHDCLCVSASQIRQMPGRMWVAARSLLQVSLAGDRGSFRTERPAADMGVQLGPSLALQVSRAPGEFPPRPNEIMDWIGLGMTMTINKCRSAIRKRNSLH